MGLNHIQVNSLGMYIEKRINNVRLVFTSI